MSLWKLLFGATRSPKADLDLLAQYSERERQQLSHVRRKSDSIVGHLSMACSKCGSNHVLIANSFMIPPQQALENLGEAGAFVLLVDGLSRNYLVGELRSVLSIKRDALTTVIAAAILEVLDGIKNGQGLSWTCRSCGYSENRFPPNWLQSKTEGAKGFPYPSDGYFRELSKKLIAEHGAVVGVRDCGIATAVRWQFTYRDGHRIVAGNPGWPIPSARVDVDFFSGMVGSEGKDFARSFFIASYIPSFSHDAEGLGEGCVLT